MLNRKYLIPFIFILFILNLSLSVYKPASMTNLSLTANLSLMTLLANPVILFLFNCSLGCMFLIFNYVLLKNVEQIQSKNKTLVRSHKPSVPCKALALLFFMVAIIICLFKATYITTHFYSIVSYLLYNSYNPSASSGHAYYHWLYGLTPAKLTTTLLIIPILLPFFYKLYQLKKNNR